MPVLGPGGAGHRPVCVISRPVSVHEGFVVRQAHFGAGQSPVPNSAATPE